MMRMHNKQVGLSLIELMVTLAIIAVISGIAIPAYNGFILNARFKECFDEVASLELAEANFRFDNPQYFMGPDIATIAANSNGYYAPSPTFANGTANCTIAITPGPLGPQDQYRIVATGANDLINVGQMNVKQNY